MRRRCKIFSLEWLFKDYPDLRNSQVIIYIDEKHEAEIRDVINKEIKKSRRIFYEMLSNRYNNDLYGKEDANGKAKGVTGMKYKGRSNERIYCKEFHVGAKKVVMISTILKRTQKNNSKINDLLIAISKYEYEFE